MGRYFEIRYAPDSWNTPPGGVSVAWSSPYGGLHTQAPPHIIPPQYSPSLNNVMLRNNAITSRPILSNIKVTPEGVGSPVAAVGTFLARASLYGFKTFALSNSGLYEAGAGAWSVNKGGNGMSVISRAVWQAFEGILYWSGGGLLASGHTSAWDGGSTALTDIAFSGAVNPPALGQTLFGGSYIGELANRIILANVGEVPFGGGQVSQFPQRIRWSNNGFNPTITNFGDNLGTAGATFDPNINSGAGFTDFLDVGDVITGLVTLGRMGYVFRTNGISEMTPTGNGQAPFNFNHLWSSQNGTGNPFIGTVAQYGAMAAFISTENAFVISPSGLKPIGGGARDAIIADIANANAVGNRVLGVIISSFTGPFIYLTYVLAIKTSNTSTKWYVYSFEDDNWSIWTTSSTLVLVPPSVVIDPSGSVPRLWVPTANAGAANISTFDPTNFNDTTDGSTYSWKAEPVAHGRVPTVRRVVLEYVDLGACVISVTVSGTNDNGATVSQTISGINIGNLNAGATITKFVDVPNVTCFRPQVTVTRAANAGPLRIVAMTMIGEVEEQQL